MILSSAGSVSAKLPQKRKTLLDCSALGPMLRQDAGSSHGHEMYPQEFVRLVGCHDQNGAKHEIADHLH
jgi:hypothetical protein